MRNFTLGKKGIPMLLFALILLIDNVPSFAQTNCPSVSNTSQSFCYLATVSDLQATANGDGVRWYRTATSTTAIPADEVLHTNSYFAGNNSGSCTSRTEVSVTIDDYGAPESTFGNTFSPCEYSTDDTSTVADLTALIDGNNVEIYNEEFSGDPLPPNTVLVEGNSYYAGQRNPDTNCPTSRIALRYDPVLTEAPTGDEVQTFCPGATVADLVANGTSPNFQAVRWYSTATSNPQLSSSTPLINGESYYATQIVNRSNSTLPPCESIDRLMVTVELTGGTVTTTTQDFCVDSDDPSTTPHVSDLTSPYGNPFFTDDTFSVLLDPAATLVDGEDYFTANQETCEVTAITVTLTETPNAGDDENITICSTELVDPTDPTGLNHLIARFNSLIAGRDEGGKFTNSSLEDLAIQYSTSGPSHAGTYSTTYTVTSTNGNCSDSANFTVTVTPATPVDAGTIDSFSVCTNDSTITLADLETGATGGTFTLDGNEITTFNPSTADLGDNDITYTVNGNPDDCTSGTNTATFTINVNQAPNAGDDVDITICSTELVDPTDTTGLNHLIARFNSLIAGRDEGGKFTNSSLEDLAIQYSTSGPSHAGTYSTTYTVTSTNGNCSDSANFTVTVTPATPVDAGTIDSFSVCTNDSTITLADLETGATGGTFSLGESEITTFDPSTADLGANNITYTVNGNPDDCTSGTDSEAFTINVNQAPNAGGDGSVVFSKTDPADNLFNYLTGSPDRPGTFSPGNANGSFDPATGTAGVYTYTVSDDCSDSATVTVSFKAEENCPVVSEEVQEFCRFFDDPGTVIGIQVPRVRNLSPATATWYSSQNGTTSIPSNTPLVDGQVYYAGNTNGTCDSRASVTVRIFDQPSAGSDTTIIVCEDEDAFDVVPRIKDDAEFGPANTGGTFSPAFASGTTVFNPAVDAAGVYTYTSDNGVCDPATSQITIQFIDTPIPANAGTIDNQTYCSNDEPVDLYSLVSNDEGVYRFGQFTNVDGNVVESPLNLSGLGGTMLTLTYTVSDELTSCVTGMDSTSFTITVNDPVPANAGDIADQTVCSSMDSVNLSDYLAGSGATPGGTFSGSGVNNNMFDPSIGPNENGYTITYTVNANDPNACVTGEASSTFTITVTDPVPANAGDISDQTVCANDGLINLSDYLAGSGATPGGTFSGEGVNDEGMFDASVGSNEDGYTITYTVNADDPNACVTGEASSTFVITVNDPVAANAGTIADQTVCSNDDPIKLADYLADSGATPGGTFSGDGVNDNMFDPSIGANEGGYTITYTVNEDDPNACVTGEATSTFVITVNDPAEAPVADAEQSFCLIDNPTVADLVVEGDDITIYTDADLTMMADPADALVNEGVYYAVASADNTCGSPATMITVTINDAIAPTLSTDGDQFCRQDSPTVQDLINNLNGNGIQIYASSSGGSPISASTALVNGTTYYASATDPDLGCESTERFAVTAAVNFCGIPEGFSPNGDNINDRFVIPDIREDYPNFTLEVYNRWGNMVFKGNAATPDWDGVSNQSTTLGNDVVPAGVYFYILNYNDGQTPSVQGKLYLSR